jgi:hypothetical protein
MKRLLGRVLDKWAAAGVPPCGPVAPAELAAFERRYEVYLPADFREYLGVCGGMGADEVDEDLFHFWEFSRIRPLPEELPDAKYRELRDFPGAARFFCFVDWSLDADIFAIELHAEPSEPNRIAGLGPRFLDVSGFAGFVETYLKDYRGLLE